MPAVNETKEYNLASEIAEEIFKALDQDVKIHDKKLESYTEREIWGALELFLNNALTKNSPLYAIFNEMKEEKVKRETDIYYTQVYTSTNGPIYTKRAQNTLNLLGKVYEQYPDISSEFIQFWIKKENNLSFFEAINLPPQLRKHYHIIEVSNETYKLICDTMGISYNQFPEYYLRDIGVRLGKGQLLMTGTEDVYPPFALFDIAQRKLDSPLGILRSNRQETVETMEQVFEKYYTKRTDNPFTVIDYQEKYTFNDHYYFAWGETGDIQGAARRQIYELNGWAWGSWVWFADGGFLFDQATFKAPYYEIRFAHSYHQYHERISSKSIHYDIDDNMVKVVKFCAGYPSKDVDEFVRPNWGISYDFKNKTTGKYGHLQYRIKPKVLTPPYVSEMEVFITYNDDQYDYKK